MHTVSYNGTEPPKLGDRIVNLYATGVPFGLRGTIVAIHSNTGYAEVRTRCAAQDPRFHLMKWVNLLEIIGDI